MDEEGQRIKKRGKKFDRRGNTQEKNRDASMKILG